MDVCNTITFEESSFLVRGDISKEYRLSSYVKVIESRSRSQEQKAWNQWAITPVL